jgi:hypothetical protein
LRAVHIILALLCRAQNRQNPSKQHASKTYPEIVDTAVKIGLGALIAAGSAFVVAWLGYRRDAQKVYIAAKRAHLDKVIGLLNDFHKAYPPVRSAMDHHFRRIEKGEQDTVQQKEEFERRRTALAEAFLSFTDAEGCIVAMGAKNTNDALTSYIDVGEAFHRDARFDNSSFTRAKLDEAQASMRKARLALLQAIAEEYKKAK